MEIKNIYDILQSKMLFGSLGIGQPIDGFEQIQSEEEAVSLWQQKDFAEARIIAWEAMRTEIIPNSSALTQWKQEFCIATELVLKAIQQISSLENLFSRYALSVDDFVRDLPFIGAVGEVLAFGNDCSKNFFRFQLEAFAKGHWICCWRGKAMLEQGIYPSTAFAFY